jgi:hypothetical protein
MSLVHVDASEIPMSEGVVAAAVPTSFGVFKPVGWMMVGLPTQQQSDAAVMALYGAGWPGTQVLHFAPSESVAELQSAIANAGPLAGFGYEITMLRRYLALAREGYKWLLVEVDDTSQAAAAAELVRACGATLAVRYRSLTVEELI